MSSILTNNSAMVALETLRNINRNLETVQSEISTGKKVANAKDNAGIWAIATVMSSDVESFKAISDSLNLGSSTVGVARSAAEKITATLQEVKSLVVSAQGENVDRTKIQADIDEKVALIEGFVAAAQFNGLNLLDGTNTSIDVLASLDRTATGVTASSITVDGQNLSTGAYTAKDVFSASTAGTISGDGDTFVVSLDAGGGSDDITIDGTATYAAGDTISLRLGDKTASYTLTDNDIDSGNNTVEDIIALGLKSAIDALGIDGLVVDYDSATPGELVFTNDGTTDLAVTGQFKNAGSGGLGALSGLSVTTASNATAALASIEDLIQTSIDAASAFGSSQSRISSQAEFVKSLSDSLTSGIGGLTDSDIEAASAKLQALQVQQQLGVQALSIANQQPQSLLSLFR
jgi:flagellin